MFSHSQGNVMSRFRFLGSVLAALALNQGVLAADLLDANTASEAELAAVSDADTAAAIVAARPFDTVGALNEVLEARMADKELETLYGRIFVPIDLNTASEEDILLIPGVGPRMAHEFEEYRPYTSMEQFRREIGKYVDEDEVARLEGYVTLD